MSRAGRRARRSRVGLTVAVAVAVVALAAGASAATLADYPDFSDMSGLALNVDAAQSGAVLRLSEAQADKRGSAFTEPRPLKAKRSWRTSFAFSMHDGGATVGEGMAFVVQSVGISVIGAGGGGLGYQDIPNSVAVEFDTLDSGDGDDGGNEVAVALRGRAGAPIATATPAFGLYGGERHAWVAYNAKTRQLKVWVDDDEDKPRSPLLVVRRNLAPVLGGKSNAGFTAATGTATAVHDVLSWKLTQ